MLAFCLIVGFVITFPLFFWNLSYLNPSDILKLGGSAVDSAIAALLCTSVIHPQSMGVGGGSIFTIRDASGKVQIINARETVPKNFNPELLKKCTQSFQSLPGTEWIGVPGEVRAYEEVHRQYGKLPWASLFQPTIKMAREGIPLSPVLARFLKLFTDKNGKLLKEGDTLRFEKLADTLEVIAEKGADAFYTGEIARSLISDIKDAGGILSLEDLNSFEVSVTSAWKVPLGDFDMYIPPPPAGGATLSFILNTMRGYNLSSESLRGKQKTLTFHRYVETCKFANGLKKFLRDPRFGSERGFAMKMRALISSSQTYGPQHYNVTPYLDSWGTTHLSVLAEDGSAVSVTSTINHMLYFLLLHGKQVTSRCSRFSDNKQDPAFMICTIMIWACFSYYGVGPIYRIPGIMDQFAHVKILEKVMLPYAKEDMGV
uniref:Gamma-glutamyltransferase 5a n=1 Tax=Denticeps clupeoides TaxID=299321 RepID=A0AAY4C3I8_9TELE